MADGRIDGAQCDHLLPLPLGEVAERGEDGEGKLGCSTLSVTFGDSSPRGRAKGLRMVSREMERICTDTLHLLFYDHPFNAACLPYGKTFTGNLPQTIYFIRLK